MAITKVTTDNGTEVLVGPYRLALFTLQTDMTAIDRFMELCTTQEDSLLRLSKAYEEAIAWNMANKGKSWPVFGQRERTLNKLCAMAGIEDS